MYSFKAYTLPPIYAPLKLVLSPQDLCSALAYDDAWRHGVANCHTWHDRAIRNAKIFNSIDFKVAIDYRHIVSTHLSCTCFVREAHSPIANEVFKFGAFQVSRHHLALDKWP